ncbi:hypothetical protein BD779DRAFT_1682884 [Infundibulicybe gibba]|nr:hypothetical protein BD779DRAFT_1682884 [Infundibulicybe gibba]
MEDGPFSTGLLDCLKAPDLSALELTQLNDSIFKLPRRSINNSRSILLFTKNPSANLTSFTLRCVLCSPQDLVDLSSLIPMATRPDPEGLSDVAATYCHFCTFSLIQGSEKYQSAPKVSEFVLSGIFYSRLYLVSSANIIENTSPPQHAELYLPALSRISAPTYFGELFQDRLKLRGLVSQLQRIYSETVGLDEETPEQAVSHTSPYPVPLPKLLQASEAIHQLDASA